jgi:hypothetical protein
LTIFSASDVPLEGVQVLFTHQKQWSLLLDLACFEHLNVMVVTQFATNEQPKDLTHMLCFQIPCCKLYKKNLFSYAFT